MFQIGNRISFFVWYFFGFRYFWKVFCWLWATQTTKHAAPAHPRSHKFSCHKIRKENNQRSLTWLCSVKTLSSSTILSWLWIELSFDELAGGNRNYTQVGNSEINIEQKATNLITPVKSLIAFQSFCTGQARAWSGPRPGQAISLTIYLQSSAKKLSGVFSFPPANPAPPWLVPGWCWAWRKIPGTANISVNTFISMRIYIQFLCQNTVRKYSILPSEKEKINKYSKHCTVTQTFDETWFENSLLFYQCNFGISELAFFH